MRDRDKRASDEMTIRDYFAGGALSELLAAALRGPVADIDYGAVAEQAYEVAEAMLDARADAE